jgi:hypothetical protein
VVYQRTRPFVPQGVPPNPLHPSMPIVKVFSLLYGTKCNSTQHPRKNDIIAISINNALNGRRSSKGKKSLVIP